MKIAVFASGNGSNFQALAEDEQIRPHLALLISDRPDAYVLERAQQLAIPAFAAAAQQFSDKAAFETELLQQLDWRAIDFIVLAGYMRLIGPTLLSRFPQQIVNLHPSLLPKFPGKAAIEQALAAGETKTGVTAHFVDAGMDSGPIIAQTEVAIAPTDDLASLTAKIHQTEHHFYPKVVKELILKQGEGFKQ